MMIGMGMPMSHNRIGIGVLPVGFMGRHCGLPSMTATRAPIGNAYGKECQRFLKVPRCRRHRRDFGACWQSIDVRTGLRYRPRVTRIFALVLWVRVILRGVVGARRRWLPCRVDPRWPANRRSTLAA